METIPNIPVISNPLIWVPVGRSIRYGMWFDGSNDTVLANGSSFNAKTTGKITGVFQTTSTGIVCVCAATDAGDTASDLRINISSGKLQFAARENSGHDINVKTDATYNDGEAHTFEVKVTASGTSITMDGVLLEASELTYTTGSAASHIWFSDVSDVDIWAIGVRQESTPDNKFLGVVRDIKVYDEDTTTVIGQWNGYGNTNADWLDQGTGNYGMWFDNLDDNVIIATPAVTVDVKMKVTQSGSSLHGMTLASSNSDSIFLFASQSGSSATISSGSGSPTITVDGVAVTTRGALFTALADGLEHEVIATDADLSAWTTVYIGNYEDAGYWVWEGLIRDIRFYNSSTGALIHQYNGYGNTNADWKDEQYQNAEGTWCSGGADPIQLGAALTLEDGETLSMEVQPNSHSSADLYLARWDGQARYFYLRQGWATEFRFYDGASWAVWGSSAAIFDGEVHELKLTRTGTSYELFLDDVSKGSHALTNGVSLDCFFHGDLTGMIRNVKWGTRSEWTGIGKDDWDDKIGSVDITVDASVQDAVNRASDGWGASVNYGRTFVIPGTAGNYLSVPDASDLDGFGDFTVQAEDAILADWSPSSSDSILSKYKASTSKRSWNLSLTSKLRITLSIDGSAYVTYSSTVNHGIPDHTKASVRAVRSGSDILFYKDVGSGWVKIGDTVSAVDTVLYDTPSQLEIGSYSGGASSIGGSITRARVWNNATQAGTPVFDVNAPVDAADGDVSFVATTGQTVTVNQTGTPSARVGGASDGVVSGSPARAVSTPTGWRGANDGTVAGSPSRAISTDGGSTWAAET